MNGVDKVSNYFRREPRLSFYTGFILLLVFFLPVQLYAALPEWPLKEKKYAELPSSLEINQFFDGLVANSKQVVQQSLGRSAGGREVRALLISTTPEFLSGDTLLEGEKLTVMLVGGQHGTEPSGAEVLQLIARQLVNGEMSDYLEHMNFVIIPNANPDGRDNRKRVNENGVNLSTDYVILSQPETRLLAKALRHFMPHVVLDIHESAILKKKSLGAQGFLTDFEAQFEIANHPNVESNLQTFVRSQFLPAVLATVKKKGVPTGHYIGEITNINQVITHGGISMRNFRNYAGMSGALSMLLENRLDPKEGDYPTARNIKIRVDKQRRSVEGFLDNVSAERKKIIELVTAARDEKLQVLTHSTIYLTEEYVGDPQQPTIHIPLRQRNTGKLINKRFEYRPRVVAGEPLTIPAGYLIKKHQQRIATLLDFHGVDYTWVKKASTVMGKISRIESLNPEVTAKGSRSLKISVTDRIQKIEQNPGDLRIDLDLPSERIVPLILDPRSASGIFQRSHFGELLREGEDFFVVQLDPQLNLAKEHQ
ncbi:MAG: hypothetical protein GXP14_16060 [Gammaproteobacteria bacterium]|nr:hypothetical protein [Gammaproteobacteria bacterium]